MQFIAIVGFSVAAAVLYGIVHDQITARICLEYYTVGHPPIFHTDSPTLLALGWGVVATWWVGLPLGILLACAARVGKWPRIGVPALIRPTAILLLIMGLFAAGFGFRGLQRARQGTVQLPAPLAAAVPRDRHPAFIADWYAHSASYAVGGLGGFVLCFWIVRSRWHLTQNN